MSEPETGLSAGAASAEKPDGQGFLFASPAPKETKPKFEALAPGPVAVGTDFKRETADPTPSREPLPAPPVPVVETKAEEPKPEEKVEESKAEDVAEESSAVVPAEDEVDDSPILKTPENARAPIAPLEIDYSGFEPMKYFRVDPNINLRLFQEEAVGEFFETKLRRVVIALPTGCGKTTAGLAIAGKVNGRVLWLAHRDELIEQAAKEIQQHFPGLDYGIEKASIRDGHGKRIVIASVQTLQKVSRLKEIMGGAPISVVIYDECHHAVSKSAFRLLSRLGCLREDGKGPLLLGLTATIERADKTNLGEIFEDVIYSRSIQEAIEQGFLVPPKPIKVFLPFNKKNLRQDADGDYVLTDLDREMERLKAAQATAAAVLANCGTRKTVAFCTSIDQSRRTAEECQKLGLKAAWVSGDVKDPDPEKCMNRSKRKKILKQFSRGEIQVLCNAEVLVEGYDERSIGAVVIARPTKSQARYIQQAGRGLRTCDHKVDCILIDIVGASDLGLIAADILLKKPTIKKVRKLRKKTPNGPESSNEWEKLQSYLRSARVDLVEHGELVFARATDHLFVTAAKDGHLVLVRRKGEDASVNEWMIEHRGLIYTPSPLELQEAMSVCDTLLPSFGGGAKPDSPEWNTATSRPQPAPGVQPGQEPKEVSPSDGPIETTHVLDPEKRLPLAMRYTGGLNVADLAAQVNHDFMNTNASMFVRGLRLAFKAKKCHLLGVTKKAPADQEKWGWPHVDDKDQTPGGPMIGWIQGDAGLVDPAAVSIAQVMLKTVGIMDDINITYLRRHLGSVNKQFKGNTKDWIKVMLKDIDFTVGSAT